MDSGADIHVRTKVSGSHRYKIGETPTGGRTALDWARCYDKTDPVKASKIIALFDTYYQRMEDHFKANSAYKDQFNKAHLTQAINNGDLKLIALFLKYCPHLEKFLLKKINYMQNNDIINRCCVLKLCRIKIHSINY